MAEQTKIVPPQGGTGVVRAADTLPLQSPAPRDEVRQLARDLFVSRVTHNATGGKTLEFVARQCFDQAAAFLAVDAEYAARKTA